METFIRKLKFGLTAGIGAVAPDVIILYSKRWSMPSVTFDAWMYAGATVLYVGLAMAVAMIYPFKKTDQSWKAFALGVTLPIVISGLASLQRGIIIEPRGKTIAGTFWDLISLF